MATFPAIPDILKNSNWQKEKGKLAKVFAGKTGVGEQMNKLQGEFNKLDFSKLIPQGRFQSTEQLDNVIKLCRAEFGKVEPLRKEAYTLRDLAKRTAEQFQKNKLIPGATVTHLKNITSNADHYGVAVKSFDPSALIAELRTATQKNSDMIEVALKQAISVAYPKCVAELNKIKSAKPPVWTDEAWQAVRACAAAVAKWPKLAQVRPQWQALSQLAPNDIKDVRKHVDATEKLLATTQALMK